MATAIPGAIWGAFKPSEGAKATLRDHESKAANAAFTHAKSYGLGDSPYWASQAAEKKILAERRPCHTTTKGAAWTAFLVFPIIAPAVGMLFGKAISNSRRTTHEAMAKAAGTEAAAAENIRIQESGQTTMKAM